MKKTFNLASVEAPSFLLNLPSSFDTTVKNNVWMKEDDEPIDPEMALAEWTDLYNVLSANGFVTILPTPKECTLQDLVFVANLGIVVGEDTVIVSNFTSEPRIGEAQVGLDYFKLAGFKNIIQCPFKWEGEADLKHIKGNLYIGGYGQRSEIQAYEWMEQNFDMKIIKVHMPSEKCYHLDCMIFGLTEQTIMACTALMTEAEIKEIEAAGIEIVDVPLNYAEAGVTNNVRCHNFILNSSDFNDLDPILDKEDYKLERAKNQFLEDVCVSMGMEPVFINLSSFTKGGAMLSCLVMHLNRFSYKTQLI